MSLPQKLSLDMMQNRWASYLDPVLKNPMLSGVYVKDVVLASGDNVINHRLGRVPQGWLIVDINAAVQIYRNASFNELTLTLNSSGAATVALYVF